jgi:solute carrier family 35 protein C2
MLYSSFLGILIFMADDRYDKFKKGQINEDGITSPSFSGDAKYIILDDSEYQDDFLDEDT